MLEGFKSRMTIPVPCAASSASTICAATSSAADSWERTLRRSGHPASRLRPTRAPECSNDCPRIRTRRWSPICGWFSEASSRASRWKRGGNRRQCAKLGQDLDRDIALQLAIARAVDLTHPARPEGAEDFVHTDAGSSLKSHGWTALYGCAGVRRGFVRSIGGRFGGDSVESEGKYD